jgi:hypothetical protein
MTATVCTKKPDPLTEVATQDAVSAPLNTLNSANHVVRNANQDKVVFVSIDVTSENIDSNSGMLGRLVVVELGHASLSSIGMANIVKSVVCNGITHYRNPTGKESRANFTSDMIKLVPIVSGQGSLTLGFGSCLPQKR